MIGVITLVPFQFDWPARLALTGFTTASDVIANVVLFLPFGFFVRLGGGAHPMLAALGLSAGVELLQLAIPGRVTSLVDLAANSAGGALGGLAYDRLIASIGSRRHLAGVFALDLPVMGAVYLTIPVAWLTGLASAGEPLRQLLAVLVCVAVVPVLAAVSRHHLVPRGHSGWVGPGIAGASSLAGLVPGWYRHPLFLVGAVVGMMVLTALAARWLAWTERTGVRYELTTVRRVIPFVAAYLLAASVWPVSRLAAEWRIGVGPLPRVDAVSEVAILRLLEVLAGALLAGYVIAEARGRSALDSRERRAVLVFVAAAVAGTLTMLRGFHADQRASLLEFLLIGASLWVGGSLYWRQLAYVRASLASTDLPAPRSEAGLPVRHPTGTP